MISWISNSLGTLGLLVSVKLMIVCSPEVPTSTNYQDNLFTFSTCTIHVIVDIVIRHVGRNGYFT